MFDLYINWKSSVHFKSYKSFLSLPWSKCFRIITSDKGCRVKSILCKVTGALCKVFQCQTGISVWIEIMTSDQMIAVRLIIHDCINCMCVVGHVDFNHQSLRIVGHHGFFTSCKTYIQTDSIRIDFLEEGKITVADTKLVKYIRCHIQNDFKTKRMCVIIHCLEFFLNIFRRLIYR